MATLFTSLERELLFAPPPFGAQMRGEWAPYLAQLGGVLLRGRHRIFSIENIL
jgi:hypothetical protein